MLLLIGAVAGGGIHSFPLLTPPASILLLAIIALLARVDAINRNEHRLLANLGVAPWVIPLVAVVPALCAEILVAVTVGVRG